MRVKSVGVAQETRDHNHFRTLSVVNKMDPSIYHGQGTVPFFRIRTRLGHYLLHISFSPPPAACFVGMLRWPLLYILQLSISRSVRIDTADLDVDLLLSELHNS